MMSLRDILISVLDFTSIIKQELPQENGNVSITYPGDTLCPMVGQGYGLDFLTTDGFALVNAVPFRVEKTREQREHAHGTLRDLPRNTQSQKFTPLLPEGKKV